MDEDHYNEATLRTVADVKKHRTKGPPPLPTTDDGLLRLNNHDVVVLRAFFTKWSSLVQQETDLNDGLQAKSSTLFQSAGLHSGSDPPAVMGKGPRAPQILHNNVHPRHVGPTLRTSKDCQSHVERSRNAVSIS